MNIGRGLVEIVIILTYILRCFKTHKLDNDNETKWAVIAYIIFQDNRYINMRIILNVAMNDPREQTGIDKI